MAVRRAKESTPFPPQRVGRAKVSVTLQSLTLREEGGLQQMIMPPKY